MSEKLCYFCREHEMRPLPAGKQGERRGEKIQGAFRLLAVTRETHTHTALQFGRGGQMAADAHTALD